MIAANDNTTPFTINVTANNWAELMHAVSSVLRMLEAAPADWIVRHAVADDDESPPSATIQRRLQ